MYSYFNPNPAGRNVSDCTVRAICKATGKDWGEVYLSLCIQGYLDGDLPNANACWGAYLRSLGYRRYIMPDTCPDCYTVGKFADEHLRGTYILALGLRIGGFFCALLRQGGELVSVQIGNGDAKMVGNLLPCLLVWNHSVVKPVEKR